MHFFEIYIERTFFKVYKNYAHENNCVGLLK